MMESPYRRKRIGKKAQAATEYVHTYGWAFLAFIVIGGVTLYYSLSNTQSIIPLECQFLSGIDCLDSTTDENLLSIVVVNGFNFALSNITMNVTGTCNSTANTTDGNMYGNLNVLLENQQTTYVFECQNLSNMDVEEQMTVGYRNIETGQQHIKVGKLQFSPTG
ncbi:hypothetical protein ACFL3V_02195 [Nanoarchaeota archaeon]